MDGNAARAGRGGRLLQAGQPLPPHAAARAGPEPARPTAQQLDEAGLQRSRRDARARGGGGDRQPLLALHESSALIRTPDAEAFRNDDEPGTARAAACFRIEPLRENETRLSTETRVDGIDATAPRRFALYWMLIKPFSGWIRWEVLEGIRRDAVARSA